MCLAVCLTTATCLAGGESYQATAKVNPADLDLRFDQGKVELSLVSGVLISPMDLGRDSFRARTLPSTTRRPNCASASC
jgi:hypothetical protein